MKLYSKPRYLIIWDIDKYLNDITTLKRDLFKRDYVLDCKYWDIHNHTFISLYKKYHVKILLP